MERGCVADPPQRVVCERRVEPSHRPHPIHSLRLIPLGRTHRDPEMPYFFRVTTPARAISIRAMNSARSSSFNLFATLLVLAGSLAGLWHAQAQPTLVSSVPANGATGIPTNTTVVFTFSTAMDTDTNVTEATFIDVSNPLNPIPTSPSWSAGNTVLTCTPMPSFPANKTIYWSVSGQSAVGDPFATDPLGSFTTGTGAGGGGSGSGTNAITTFSVGKIHHYNQTSAGSPTLDPTTPYGFSGVTALSSNRTATSVVLTLPTGAVSNLTQLPPPQAEIYVLYGYNTNLSTHDATFPAGDYRFQVNAASSNQTVVVNLPTAASLPQPGAPHLSNLPAAQTVNPGQAFVLSWEAFPGGTAADYIDVDIGTAFGSPNPGLLGALTGTTVNFTIPAGTLRTNSTYASRVGFFRHVGATNANYATAAYRSTYTEFSLITTGNSQLVLTNGAFTPSNFSFDVLCSTGQTVTVEYKTNLTTGLWQTLLTTNSPGGRFHAVAPQAATNRFLFFRARNGS